jgi:hypothetical protein
MSCRSLWNTSRCRKDPDFEKTLFHQLRTCLLHAVPHIVWSPSAVLCVLSLRKQQCNMIRFCRCCCCVAVVLLLLSVTLVRELKCNRNRHPQWSHVSIADQSAWTHVPCAGIDGGNYQFPQSQLSSVVCFVSLNPSGYFLQLSRTNLVWWTRGCAPRQRPLAKSDATSHIWRVPILLVQNLSRIFV